MEYDRGSEWRRWDLHLHTASSYDAEYKGSDADALLCQALKDNNIAAVAITDHFKIDVQRIENLRKLAPDIVFFPGVELRTDKGSNNLHVILIFSDAINLSDLAADFEAIMYRTKAKAKDKPETIYWDYTDIVEFAKGRDALISIHAGKKTNGIDKELKNGDMFKEAVKDEIATTVSFFEIGNPQKDIPSYRDHVFKSIKEKPLILGSDCHNPKAYSPKEACWIKADLTFNGLKQCVFQPRERVFIGSIPPILDREHKNKTGIIDSVSIRKIEGAKNKESNWFDSSMRLNSSMVAIVGNKGSGKSALSDIIGLLCGCRTMSHASFLTEKRFRKAPKNYASDYEASISWRDGKTVTMKIDQVAEETAFEEAQYLPQQFIEEVCNDIGSFFQDEIDKVIFSYVDKTERGNAASLHELVAAKSKVINIEMDNMTQSVTEINGKIISLEKKKTAEYRKNIDSMLKQKQDLLERHMKNVPAEVKPPVPQEKDTAYKEKLKNLNDQIAEISEKIEQDDARIIAINEEVSAVETLIARIKGMSEEISALNAEIRSYVAQYHVEDITECDFTSPMDVLEKRKKKLEDEKKLLRKEIDGDAVEPGLKKKKQALVDEKEKLISSANTEERKYQKYLTDLKEWEQTKAQIVGSSVDEDSLSYFGAEVKYLDEKLESDYREAREIREALFRNLFDLKKKKIEILETIYSPVEKEIELLLGDLEDSVQFQAEIRLHDSSSFAEKILRCVNLRMSGLFKGKTESYAEVDRLIKKTEFSDFESLTALINSILKVVDDNIDASEKKVPDKSSLYDYLFGLEYIDVSFKLKMANRSLEELSPGERGIVLLIFYLALNKNNTPIIIDQPEDNLDNQSVYSKLVPCICRAKQRRQVIIVTHNPNIAVACDAEQIIYCDMDKENHQHIAYETGSIENDDIRKHVIDVLEGTMPAFDLRRQKYENV